MNYTEGAIHAQNPTKTWKDAWAHASMLAETVGGGAAEQYIDGFRDERRDIRASDDRADRAAYAKGHRVIRWSDPRTHDRSITL
jgi:hypothetical protein